ncbi:unnamed protein product [Prunus armeniaca]|uniref:Uncharacterized protein n=1 Tax=Prunus armeniaca TaxID=36596 RepID=A0A6J5TE49_PRUAR|nr:unnamed protein product [Prunus armeniaca]
MLGQSYVSVAGAVVLLIVAVIFVPSKVSRKKRLMINWSSSCVCTDSYVTYCWNWVLRCVSSINYWELQWYRLVESEHFPDPTGLRARIEQWTFGLHPACIKYFMSALDVPDVMAVTRNNICKNGMESLSRAGAIIYYASVFLYFWVFSTPSFTRFHIKSDGDLEVYTLAVDKVPKE